MKEPLHPSPASEAAAMELAKALMDLRDSMNLLRMSLHDCLYEMDGPGRLKSSQITSELLRHAKKP